MDIHFLKNLNSFEKLLKIFLGIKRIKHLRKIFIYKVYDIQNK